MEKKKKISNLLYFLLTLFNSIFSDEFKVKIIFDFISYFFRNEIWIALHDTY